VSRPLGDRPVEVIVAVHEERLDQIEAEQMRHRQRLHDLESDRQTLRFISEQVRDLAASVGSTAKQAALDAIDLAMESKDELGRRRWGLRAQWLGVGAAFGALVAMVLIAILK
jgi:hypothetical protein